MVFMKMANYRIYKRSPGFGLFVLREMHLHS